MPDTVTYSQLAVLSRRECRATIAAALIASKTIELGSITFANAEDAAKASSVSMLRNTVDVLMKNVIDVS